MLSSTSRREALLARGFSSRLVPTRFGELRVL
jgi:hypothetical protein